MRVMAKKYSSFFSQILLQTLYYSLPSLINVGSVLFLLFFIYAILGVNLFWEVKPGEVHNYYLLRIYSNPGYLYPFVWINLQELTSHSDFSTFLISMLTLFRIVTGDQWNFLMRDVMVNCDRCITYYLTPIYFISFLVLGAFVMMNLFIAIILDNFDSTMRLEDSEVKSRDLQW